MPAAAIFVVLIEPKRLRSALPRMITVPSLPGCWGEVERLADVIPESTRILRAYYDSMAGQGTPIILRPDPDAIYEHVRREMPEVRDWIVALVEFTPP